jgi:hypothetical protein
VFLVAAPGGTLPNIGVQLDGQVRILLDGINDLTGPRVKNVFGAVPDVPITTFTLVLNGGTRGVLTPTRNLCKVSNNGILRATGHNGDTKSRTVKVSVPCSKAKKSRRARKH